MEGLRRVWPHLRAAGIALHLVAVILMALPAPVGGERRENYRSPQVQAELRQWSALLGRLGVKVGPDELADHVHAASRRAMQIREAALAPFRPYYRLCGTTQSWRMFSSANLYNTQLRVEVEETPGVWRIVHESRSPAHRWYADAFDHELLRSGVYRYTFRDDGYRREYKGLARWFAARAAVEYPEARRLRVRVVRSRTPPPEDARAGIGRVPVLRRALLFDLAELRAEAKP